MQAETKRALTILMIDSAAGLLAGCYMLAMSPILAGLYHWPDGLLPLTGVVNLSYGCYSGILVLWMRRRGALPRWPVALLIAANFCWGVGCFFQAYWFGGAASALGLAHLLFEGLFVAGLAVVEARLVLPYVAARETGT